MRMRKLGKGQSVIFYIPDEIKSNIISLTGHRDELDIDVSDVLCWAISETWHDIQRSIPLWATQAERFGRQSVLWDKARKDGQTTMTTAQAIEFLEPEYQSLESRYRPGWHRSPLPDSQLQDIKNPNAHLIRERCREFQDLDFSTTHLHEEQERELAPEIEQEPEVDRPAPEGPATHNLHPDVLSFITTGVPTSLTMAYGPAFEMLRDTSAAVHLNVSQLPRGLLVTADFATTILAPKHVSFQSDAYQRPVQWILTSTYTAPSFKPSQNVVKYMMVISPYEACKILPRIRSSETKVTLHLYSPRQHEGFPPLDGLALYTVPRRSELLEIPTSLRIQLNLFSGQLYISTYREYQEICEFLGVASVKTPEGWSVAADGFILTDAHRLGSPFHQSPLEFLKVLMSQIRKDCQDISKTHIGKILDGKLLRESDFEVKARGLISDICGSGCKS